MCTNDGKLFHIDFGFILGQDPKPMAPHVRITEPMKDAMGTGPGKEKFKELCDVAYKKLR